MVTAPKKHRITLASVVSSALSHVGYDPTTLTLAVTFKGRPDVHHYEDFSPKKWKDMQAAESIGSFFSAKVRNQHPHSVPTD